MNLFKSKKPHVEYLRKKWRSRVKQVHEGLIERHFRKAALGSLGGLMLLTNSGAPVPTLAQSIENKPRITGSLDKNALLKVELIDKVPTEMRPLTSQEDQRIVEVLNKDLGIKVAPELQNKRLNRTYGMIGGEQHLYRYPGDNVMSHAKDTREWAMFGGAGIAPGLGAWGYFAPSKAAFTKQDEDREKWYIAVQTFLSPGFSERTAEYRDFYKYRKMLVVNPKTGQAVVTDIADAGPGSSTGKHLGGSPEVMHELGLATGPRKGAVLYYFIDDPENKVPLGPIKMTENMKLVKT